ncbi:hypothetical protein GCM10010193_09330 [Kitasatospora atroaurantiaca]|uniref:Uncharacterized protein n=1 Tax=Kitasatospora atroaurantiaca TaxID=285545 RepID=A0A561ES16_9ACTN|nr:hypothetical protein [Kitasatospora atroaurantiaca]TWE18384.1 hypothetical protein FB465_3453 [Kitasatospora atroaurantiaca]
MESSVLAFATDLIDEGADTFFGNLTDRAGVGGVTLASVYHEARDVFPHNPRRVVRYLEPGAAYFRPDPARWAGRRLAPTPSTAIGERDPFAEAAEQAQRRGLKLHAWTVFCHNDRLGFQHPDCAPANAFGDRYLTELCPANPEVREYATTLVAEFARYGVDAVRAESLHFHGLRHGYHHERYFEELGPVTEALLGLCFCTHCRANAAAAGVPADEVGQAVREELRTRLADERRAAAPAALDELAGGAVAAYVDAAALTVTSLAAEVAEAAAHLGMRLTFMDGGGPGKGWLSGIDLPALAKAAHQVETLGYAKTPEAVREKIAAFALHGVRPAEMAVILRPMAEDCDGPANLAAKIAVLRELGVPEVEFYNYGLMRLSSLDRIGEALRSG